MALEYKARSYFYDRSFDRQGDSLTLANKIKDSADALTKLPPDA